MGNVFTFERQGSKILLEHVEGRYYVMNGVCLRADASYDMNNEDTIFDIHKTIQNLLLPYDQLHGNGVRVLDIGPGLNGYDHCIIQTGVYDDDIVAKFKSVLRNFPDTK